MKRRGAKPVAFGRRTRLTLAGLMLFMVVISILRIAGALDEGVMPDKRGHIWSRETDPGHYWLLLIPWFGSVVLPAGATVILLRRPGPASTDQDPHDPSQNAGTFDQPSGTQHNSRD